MNQGRAALPALTLLFCASVQWQPPAAFEWRDLAYEIAGPDAVVIVGRFAWTPAPGQALLVRRDGVLRIRLENESSAAG